MTKPRRIAALVAIGAALGIASVALVGCTSDADKADQNIKTAAEAFEVQRTIIGINGITGQTTFVAEGRCSFEYPKARRVDVTCKYGPDEYRKHVFIMGDQDSVTVTQEKAIDVSEYHTRIILKPQNLLPEFDIEVGEDE
ncbi:beta-sandwich lipoprotein [Microbacterium sp. XT11]|uniref:beta-sandwich lipoprotein n=1 Tax=Microbacterium sp. XT11 TaxID=367477 RepID=UPI000742D2DC|nr:hypothetical protein [Microbacterium sp. XT11]ALX67280.1 hypothetical protein AB663_003133 [Microbacterium sp. XT11]